MGRRTRRNRKSLSAKLRFEVFKRDHFTCVYCGAKAPDVVLHVEPWRSADGPETDPPAMLPAHPPLRLHVDHVVPLALGGADSILNYATACAQCNAGKGAVALSDQSVVAKRLAQMSEAAERREQLEMLAAWQQDLIALEQTGVDLASDLWSVLVPGVRLTDLGLNALRRLIRRFGTEAVLTAMPIATGTYACREPDGRWNAESLATAIDKIGGVCVNTMRQEQEPYLPQLYQIRGLLRSRFPDTCHEGESLRLLRRAAKKGVRIGFLEDLAHDATTFYHWRCEVERVLRNVDVFDAAEADVSTTRSLPPDQSSGSDRRHAASAEQGEIETAASFVKPALQARFGDAVDGAEIDRRLTERHDSFCWHLLWLWWAGSNANSFRHWCALMDWFDAVERLESEMGDLHCYRPAPAFEALTPTEQGIARDLLAEVRTALGEPDDPLFTEALVVELLHARIPAPLISVTLRGWRDLGLTAWELDWSMVLRMVSMLHPCRGPGEDSPPAV